MRLSTCVFLFAGVLGSASPLSSCTTDSGGCNYGALAPYPAFFIPFTGAIDGAECTLRAATFDEAGTRQWMECVAYGTDCLCAGGGLPGEYEVVVYDVESGQELDDLGVTIHAVGAPECRESEVTRLFDEALSDHPFYGMDGVGGAGGGGGAGGAQ